MHRPAHGTPSNLPHPVTPLFGRDAVVARVVGQIERDGVRLLTLTGPGGIGKTRVAADVASRLAGRFPDGVWFVDLGAVVDPELAPAAILTAMGLRGQPGTTPLAGVRAAVGERQVLLVLDNLEQVVGVATGVAELLAGCPALAVIATSRIALRLRAEQQVLLAPLEDEAVDLFADRAGAIDASFRVTPEDRPVVAEICRRLDGLPLAIELAAARVDLLSPSALLAGLTDSRLPAGAAPIDLPNRQRTLHDAVAWSTDLLAPGQRDTFRRLAVFAGRFTRDEAVAVAASAAADIPSLVAHSLLRRHLDRDETTFSMLQTIRAVGREQLAADPSAGSVRAAHAELIFAVAAEADAALIGPDQRRWLRRLDRLQDDCRVVLAAGLAGEDATPALRLATDLWRYWETRGQLVEGRRWLERAVAAAGRQPTPALARALNHLGNLELDLGELTTAGAHYRAALALRETTGDQTGTADTLNNLGLVALAESRLDDATGLHGRSRAIRRALGDASGEALSLSNLGDVALAAGDHARAMALQREAAATYESLGNERRLAYALANLAEATLRPGGPDDLAAAGPLLTRAGALFDELDDPTGRALVLAHLATAAAARGDAPAALGHLRAALALRREQGQLPGVVECVERIGGLAEDPRLLAAADAIRDERGWPRSPAAAAAWAATVRAARAASTAGAFLAAWDAGRALGLERAIDRGLTMAVGPLAPAPTMTRVANGLSAREVEVLRLVAAGLTNAQIGDRLFLSHTTINAHLRRIYPKIGVDNRAAASTFAAAAGLLDVAGGSPA